MSKPFDLKFIPFSQLHISKLNMRPVSYTHLTLPTIYSV